MDDFRYNGFWLETFANSTQDTTPRRFRLRYAWFGNDANQVYTGDYAPLDEFAEIASTEFRQFVWRLSADEDFRRQQLDAQERLFTQQHEIPMWYLHALHYLQDCFVYRRSHMTVAGDPMQPQVELAFAEVLEGVRNGQRLRGTPEQEEELLQLLERPDSEIEQMYQQYVGSTVFRLTNETNRMTDNIPVLSAEIQKAADEAAYKLLKNVLSPSEFESLTKDGHLKIPSQTDPECLYIIKRNPAERIEVLRNGKLIEKLCIYFKPQMHKDDQVLAKILMLKEKEEEFLAIANHFQCHENA